jgi:hypothetical protein
MPFQPRPNALYLCDNGQCLCGLHLGSSAKHTGHDISGQAIYQIQPRDHEVGTPPFKCESCGATFGRSVKAGVIRPVLVRYKAKGNTDVFDYAS